MPPLNIKLFIALVMLSNNGGSIALPNIIYGSS